MSDYRVIHSDQDLLVVDKPAGVPTTAPSGRPSLMRSLTETFSGVDMLHATSRLDLPVTGVVVVARTRKANEELLEARQQGRYKRVYLALCQVRSSETVGSVEASTSGTWTWPISIDPGNPKLRTVGEGRAARNAQTDFRIIDAAHDVSLLDLRPMSGRTHQIRVHAAAGGLPIVGDPQYGGPRRITLSNGRVVPARRVMLHCAAVKLLGVEGERRWSFSADVPDDFQACWQAVGGSVSSLSIERLA